MNNYLLTQLNQNQSKTLNKNQQNSLEMIFDQPKYQSNNLNFLENKGNELDRMMNLINFLSKFNIEIKELDQVQEVFNIFQNLEKINCNFLQKEINCIEKEDKISNIEISSDQISQEKENINSCIQIPRGNSNIYYDHESNL